MTQLVVPLDMDGVLVNSEPLHIEKLLVVTKRHGVKLHEEDFTRPHEFRVPDGNGGMKDARMPLGGAGDKNIYWWALSQKPALAHDLSMQQWNDELLEHYLANKHTLKPREHMVEMVHNLHARNAILGVVTSGIPAQVHANLSVLGRAADRMSFVLTADDVKQSKPNPEGYNISRERALVILKKRGVANDNVVFTPVEDSEPGAQAALAANMHVTQFLLPGAKPMVIPVADAARFRVARTGEEVERQIHTFFAQQHNKFVAAPQNAASPTRPARYGFRVDPRKLVA